MQKRLICAAAGVLAMSVFTAVAQTPPVSPSVPPSAPAPTPAPAAPPPAPTDRIVITGMIPVPVVGAGAPYHSVTELGQMSAVAKQEYSQATHDVRLASESDACRDPKDINVMARPKAPTPDTIGQHKPGAPPTLQALYVDVKQSSVRVAQLAGKAAEATRKADDSRRAAAAGSLDMKTVEKIELDRQAAVKRLEQERLRLMEAEAAIADYGDLLIHGQRYIDWLDIDTRAGQRKKAGWGLGLPRTVTVKDLTVSGLKASEMQDDAGFYLRVFGQVNNSGGTPTTLPNLLVSVLDERGLVLSTSLAQTGGRRRVPPHGALPFQYDVRPSPEHVGRLVVNFSSGAEPPPELPASLICRSDDAEGNSADAIP
ncbi:MAG: hypothetical protein ABI740_08720 [Alphaproteobacteria bacterium]